MRGKDLFEKITDIDDDIIAKVSVVNKKRKPTYIKWIGLAACFAIILSVFVLYPSDKPTENSELPMLNINSDDGGEMGFEGYFAYDISELVNANPWNEDADITHLPVINNPIKIMNPYFINFTPNYELMEQNLKEVATSFGVDVDEYVIKHIPEYEIQKQIIIDYYANENEETSNVVIDGFEKHTSKGNFCYFPVDYFDKVSMEIETENYIFSTDTRQSDVLVEFKNPAILPKEYNFSYDNSTYDEIYQVALYLKDEYADFIGMENPIIDIYSGDYSIYGDQSYDIAFYENSNDDVQNILNYNFKKVQFSCDSDGKLFLARKYYTDLSDIVGEYPIIDVKEATNLLENGNYITTVPEEFRGTEYIKKVELIYRNSALDEVFMPYYRFYVELIDHYNPDDSELNTYGAYYVPAVEGQYIENMPKWDGSFNQ